MIVIPDRVTRELDENQARGEAWLDATYPDWWQAIDLDELNLYDCQACVAGQVARHYLGTGYDYGSLMATLSADDPDVYYYDAVRAGQHGFTLSCTPAYLWASSFEEAEALWRYLEGRWAEAIRTRQTTAKEAIHAEH